MDTALNMRVVPEGTVGDLLVLNLMQSLWDETCEDGADFNTYQRSPLDLWVEFYYNKVSVGAIRLREFNKTTLQLCINIRKEHRAGFSHLCAKAIHEWVAENIEKHTRMVAVIPSYFENVIEFTKRSGWHEEGIMQEAFLKDGTLHNLHIFGKKIIEMRA